MTVQNQKRLDEKERVAVQAHQAEMNRLNKEWKQRAAKEDFPKALVAIEKSVKQGKFEAGYYVSCNSHDETYVRANRLCELLRDKGYVVPPYYVKTHDPERGCVVSRFTTTLRISWTEAG